MIKQITPLKCKFSQYFNNWFDVDYVIFIIPYMVTNLPAYVSYMWFC